MGNRSSGSGNASAEPQESRPTVTSEDSAASSSSASTSSPRFGPFRRRKKANSSSTSSKREHTNSEQSHVINNNINAGTSSAITAPAENALVENDEQKMSYLQMARLGYNEIVNAIIRPPRAEYELEKLGPEQFSLDGKIYIREDFQLRNERGRVLECSQWKPRKPPAEPLPCIVYLHGNASCRVEALECLPMVLDSGFTLVALDFAGSGHSEGEYISLGFYEKDDVKTVIHHLRQSNKAGAIGLWGRSMGAVTALMHADRDPTIACLILDSPFTSLRTLARELVEHAQLSVPKWAVGFAMKFVRSSVKSRAEFDLNKLEPIVHAKNCYVPAVFGAAEEDVFIRPHHSEELSKAYGGSKNLVLFKGDHNSERPSFFYHSVQIFLQSTMVDPFGQAAAARAGTMAATGGSGDTGSSDQPETWNAQQETKRYEMPAPLAASGAGIGISVGVPTRGGGETSGRSKDENALPPLPSYVWPGSVDGGTDDEAVDDDDASFDELLQHAIAVSLLDQQQQQQAPPPTPPPTSTSAIIETGQIAKS